MNITDIEDKIIRDARINFPDLPPMEALKKLTTKYGKVFIREMAEIGNDVSAFTFMNATDNIAEMQELILKLLQEKIAYLADDGVYFSISAYQKSRKYGQLSKIELADETRSRIDNDEYDKDSAADFALWKREKDGEPTWDFWISQRNFFVGKDTPGDTKDTINLRGRPGWHIECSAMSVKSLRQPFDIHTGGIDLIFPHHENEIAQSTAGDQPDKLAKFFVHNEHLLVDGTKMAKSKNNFFTLVDIKKRGFDPLDFRLLVLQSHYRSATNFSWENLTAAQNRRRNWRNTAELRWQTADSSDDGQAEIINNLLDEATQALQNDLDTPTTLKFIDQAIDVLAKDPTNINHFALNNLIKFIDDNLGLKLAETTPDISDEQKELIAQRQSARAENNWNKSDNIRDQLKEQGILLNDTGKQTIWSQE
jgi:cysteinyl-tRNA synthetase